jgi:hypothetical protein
MKHNRTSLGHQTSLTLLVQKPQRRRQVLECAGKAKRRRRFRVADGVSMRTESGVALPLPPHSKSWRRNHGSWFAWGEGMRFEPVLRPAVLLEI